MIKAVLFDIDGTLCMDGNLFDRASQVVDNMRKDRMVFFVTNTTGETIHSIIEDLSNKGITVNEEELYSPVRVAKDHMVKNSIAGGMLMVPDKVKEDYAWFKEDADGPSLLVGDECYHMTVDMLHEPFRFLMQGGKSFFTLQKNRYYRKNGQLIFDMGPVTALLEYATGSNCRVFGKPSEMLFKTIAEKAGCTIDELAIVGDDIEFDILSPMQYGVKGIAVRTGKFIKEVSDQKIKEYGYSPDHTIDGIWQLDKVI